MSPSNSSTSSNEAPEQYGAEDQIANLERTVTESTSQNPNDNVLTRLETLSRSLSHMTRSDMSTFQIDANDFDLKQVLKFLASRNEDQGVQQKKTDVFFEDLTVIGKNSAAAFVADVGSAFTPITKLLKGGKSKQEKLDLSKMPKTRKCIQGVTGFAAQGAMVLVLGRPGSGCSTMLKAIGGETQTYIKVEGDVSYDGIPRETMIKKYKDQLIYVPELDEHFPYLTVEETLKFAIGCKTPAVRVDNVSRDRYISTIKDLYTVLFGLKHVEKTLVGNDFVRGISGGQRKRVSIAEAMSTRGTVYCYDNATRGLDASTALEFVEALRTSINITETTALVTAYQASENIYQLFDHVTVLYLGRQVYFGPIGEAVDYFVNLGFEKPTRQTSSEFLTAVTDPLERKPRRGFEHKVPTNADEFEQCWRNSTEFANLKEEIARRKSRVNTENTMQMFHDIHRSEQQRGTGKDSLYTVNFLEQLRLCTLRGFRNNINNISYSITFVVVAIVQAFVVGSSYYNTTETSMGSFSRGGVIFFDLLYFSIMSLASITALFENKPIINKQRGYTLYHPSAQIIAGQISDFPARFIGILAFSIPLYFLSNLKREAGAFFSFVLFSNVAVQAVNSFFTLLASLTPDINSAHALTGVFVMMMILYSSFLIQRPSMYWWFKWFSYMNPILYGFESMITMEFRGRIMECSPSEVIPSGTYYASVPDSDRICGFTGSHLSRELYPDAGNIVSGDVYMEIVFDYFFKHCWRNLGILILMILGFVALNCILVEKYNPMIAAADKLIFVKGGHIPQDIAKVAGLSETETSTVDDLEAGDLAKEPAQEQDVQHSSSSTDTTPQVKGNIFTSGGRLGSNDIFMWQNVEYVVPYQGEQRKLLDKVDGWVLPGTLTALMGESGAGKTTLLNVLSRRTDVGVVTGDLLINGKPLDSTFERRTGYVQQQDVHISELTVRESLLFAARLRRPASVPDAEKVEYVEKVMEILNMDDYADAIAGKLGFGLNVEQRKKLSIATELVAKPSLLLFLDEPTSGLDSQSAWAIVQVLRQLAAAGQAILCTIHQPSATLFEQFDRLLLLKVGGQTVYFGDIGKNSSTVLNYFESQGARKCQPTENSAEYLLEVIGAGATASVNEDWHQLWAKSPESKAVHKKLQTMIRDSAVKIASRTTDHRELEAKYAAPYRVQFAQVFRRTWTQFSRDLVYLKAKIMLMVLGGLVHGFSFWRVKHTVIGMQNTMFANFMAIVISAPLTNQIQARAIESRELFEVRESKSHTFHWSTLLISQFLTEIPYSVFASTLYFIAWYFPIGLSHSATTMGFWWLNYCIFFQLYYVSLGLGIVYASPDLPSANVILGMIFNFIIGFCGVVQLPSLLPTFWKFMWRASPFTYYVDSMLSTCIHDREVVCSSEEMNYLEPVGNQSCGEYLSEYFETHNGYLSNPDDYSNCGVCSYKVGDQYLSLVGMSMSHRWRNVGLYFVYILFNLWAMLFMYWLFRVRGLSIKLPSFKSAKPKAQPQEDEDSEDTEQGAEEVKDGVEETVKNDVEKGQEGLDQIAAEETAAANEKMVTN